jgi:hypothetical protein
MEKPLRSIVTRSPVTSMPVLPAQTDKGFGIIARSGGMVIGNVVAANKALGLVADGGPVGFVDNTLTENNNNNQQVTGELLRVDPNACKPTSAQCP